MNTINLIGRLTKDPDLRYSPNGVAICTFTLAVNRDFTNQNGEREADFIQCKAFKKTAENLANYQQKGSQVGVVGRLQTGSYEKDGQRVYTTDVMVDRVEFLGSKAVQSNQGSNGDPFANSKGPIEVSEDEIPF
ncbi:single-stranded DNA-binding protein [Lysinibacillus sp. FSL M8-0216]|uniref:single-stranded DNA-binding protein n=1 Tax=Lysinibacillus sp. FSL M8-0216 TaxID=2921619 RepID=UPI00315B1605